MKSKRELKCYKVYDMHNTQVVGSVLASSAVEAVAKAKKLYRMPVIDNLSNIETKHEFQHILNNGERISPSR
jgi:hypothetical protein